MLTLAVAAVFSFISCNDEGTVPENEQLANEQNATEDAKISVADLESDIEISGAIKETGTPPAPNSNLNFQLNTDLTEAFQGSGFTIEFSSTASIAGAYIQFREVDGSSASSYFDVSWTSFQSARTLDPKTILKKKQSSLVGARSIDEFESEIDINFGDNLPAGQFCYDICLYDEDENISQIQTVCVTVEAWGGNAAIVGEWVFDKVVPNLDEDYQESIECNNGQTILVDYEKDNEEQWTFVLNDDGSYYEIYDFEGYYLDYQATVSSCSAVYYNELDASRDKYLGFWAFNEEEQTLTVIDFGYEDLLNSEYSEEYEDGSLYFEGVTAEVIDGQLVLSIEEEGLTLSAYFNPKE